MMCMQSLASTAGRSVTPRLSGRFEEVVLASLLRLGCTTVGCSARAVRIDIEAHLGEKVSVTVLYATLGRLEEKGFISSQVIGPTGQPGIRSKRLFMITEYGYNAMLEVRRYTQRAWAGVDEGAVAA